MLKFVTFLSISMVLKEEVIEETLCHILRKQPDGNIYLCIKLPNSDKVAQYVWENYVFTNREENEKIIRDKVSEAQQFYQNTFEIVGDIFPNLRYHTVARLLKQNSCASQSFTDNRKILKYSYNISLEEDMEKHIWLVCLGEQKLCIKNKNAAIEIYRTIEKDLDNFIITRWGCLSNVINSQ